MTAVVVFFVTASVAHATEWRKLEPITSQYRYQSDSTQFQTRQQSQTNVSVLDDVFSPTTITVTVGTSVMWTNNGMHMHTITADDGSFDSGSLNPGMTFSHTFTSPGTFPYYCQFHGAAGGIGMAGTVIVTEQTNSSPVMNPSIMSPIDTTQPMTPMSSLGYDYAPRTSVVIDSSPGIFIIRRCRFLQSSIFRSSSIRHLRRSPTHLRINTNIPAYRWSQLF